MKHDWIWDEENKLKICCECGYIWAEESYRKCNKLGGL